MARDFGGFSPWLFISGLVVKQNITMVNGAVLPTSWWTRARGSENETERKEERGQGQDAVS